MSALRELAVLTADALRPFEQALADPSRMRALALRLGWRVHELPPAWTALADPVRRLVAAVEALDDDPGFADIVDALAAAADLRSQLDALTIAPPAVDADAFLADLRDHLFEHLLVVQVARSAPRAFGLLSVLGIIASETGSRDHSRIPHTQHRIDLERLSALIRDPRSLPALVYGWGTESFDADWLTGLLFELLVRLRLPAQLERGSDLRQVIAGLPVDGTVIRVPILDRGGTSPLQLGLVAVVVPADAGGPALVLAPWLPVLGDGLPLAANTTLRALAGDGQPLELGLVITPTDLDLRFPGSGGMPEGGLGFELATTTALRLGTATGTRFEADGVAFRAFVDRDDTGFVATAELVLDGARLALAAGDQDGIVGRLLGDRELAAPVPIAVRWSSRDGLSLALAAGALGVPGTITLGPVRLDRTRLALGADDTTLFASITANVAAAIGPVTLELDQLGARVRLDRAQRGALGLGSIDADIVLPTGGGVAIDAGVVAGTGRVTRDPATGGYAGGVQLQLSRFEALGAVVLDKQTPDGLALTSCIALAAARFPGIPIGLGFTLDGLGAIFALGRTFDVERARAAARAGGLAQLLAPNDPHAGMAALLDRLRELFPPAPGRFVAGPSMRIGWGSPALLVADVVMLTEAPAPIRVIVLATASIGLPTIEHPIVDLHIDAIGVVDLGRGTLAIDASLHDSSIAGYELTGDLALRMGWSDDNHFLAALGGFHPAFRPPPGFPALRRLALTIGDNPSLRLESYLALTSNSVQVGARVDLAYKASGLTIGGHLRFDALFELRPFHVETEISAGVAISYRGHDIASATLDFTLVGPRPWRAHGTATIGILWWDVTVGFDATWGDRGQPSLPPPPDPGDVLREGLADPRAWRGELPPGERAWIALRDRDGDGAIAIHPLAEIVVQQRAVPLDHPITAFGGAPLPAERRFAIDKITIGTATTIDDPTPTSDQFAPGQFAQLGHEERLAAPSFEAMHAGVRIGRDAVTLGATARVSMAYDTDVDDPLAPPARPPEHGFAADLLGVLVAQRWPTRIPTPPPAIVVRAMRFAIVSVDDLGVDDESEAVARGSTSYATLRANLRAASPSARRRLQIVPVA